MNSVKCRIAIMLLPMILIFSGTAFSRIDDYTSDFELDPLPGVDEPGDFLDPVNPEPNSDQDIDIDFEIDVGDSDKPGQTGYEQPINCVRGATCIDLDPDEAVFEEVLREMLDIPSNHHISTHHLWQLRKFVVDDDRSEKILTKSLSRLSDFTWFFLGTKGEKNYAEGFVFNHRIHYGTTIIDQNGRTRFFHGIFDGHTFVPGLMGFAADPRNKNESAFNPGVYSNTLGRFVPGIAVSEEFGYPLRENTLEFMPGVFTEEDLDLENLDHLSDGDGQEVDSTTGGGIGEPIDTIELDEMVIHARFADRLVFSPGYYEADPNSPLQLDLELGTFTPGIPGVNDVAFPAELIDDIKGATGGMTAGNFGMDMTGFGPMRDPGSLQNMSPTHPLIEFDQEFERLMDCDVMTWLDDWAIAGVALGGAVFIGAVVIGGIAAGTALLYAAYVGTAIAGIGAILVVAAYAIWGLLDWIFSEESSGGCGNTCAETSASDSDSDSDSDSESNSNVSGGMADSGSGGNGPAGLPVCGRIGVVCSIDEAFVNVNTLVHDMIEWREANPDGKLEDYLSYTRQLVTPDQSPINWQTQFLDRGAINELCVGADCG